MGLNKMLFSTERHFKIECEEWQPEKAHEIVGEILRVAESALTEEMLWPVHPLDKNDDRMPNTTMYYGAGGVAWGLDKLHKKVGSRSKVSYNQVLESCIKLKSDPPNSYFFGETGLRLALQSIAPTSENLGELKKNIQTLALSETNELMAGAPGALVAFQLCSKFDKENEELARGQNLVDSIMKSWVLDPNLNLPLWQQNYVRPAVYLGAAHGAVGNIFALLSAQRLLTSDETQDIQKRAIQLVKATAIENETEANWPAQLPQGKKELLVHWCHGAPGIVMMLSNSIPVGLDESFDRLLNKAGNLIWNAGGIEKGASLCHGTSGSGAALLKLFERTQDEIWLKRARFFAMAGIRQMRNHRQTYKDFRYSLWTGDIGSALFLLGCCDERFEVPMLEMI